MRSITGRVKTLYQSLEDRIYDLYISRINGGGWSAAGKEEAMSKCCGNCEFSKYDREQGEFVCQCEESENYALFTEYRGSCEEFVEKG